MIRVRRAAARFRVAGLMFAFLVLAGCATKGDLTGTVKYKNEPLKFGQVNIQAGDGKLYSADIQPDGTYAVKGLPVGAAKIGVFCTDTEKQVKYFKDLSASSRNLQEGKGGTPAPKGDPAQFNIVPAKYNDVNGSGLSVDVKGGAQVHNIDIP